MGLFDSINLFNNTNWLFTPMSYGYAPSSFSSFAPLFNFNSGNRYYFGSTSSNSYYFPPAQKSYNFDFSSYSSSKPNSTFGNLTFKRSATGDLQRDLVNNALSWVGKVNNDATGNRLFSNGKSQAWCADFVTYNTRKTFGSKLPSSFGSSSVSGLMNWGKNNNCYLDVTSASNKADFIAQNVKVGDIMIEKRGGKSHTGIVTKVNSDGSFETVEGNTSDKVAERKYTANSSTLSGFVALDKYVA
ncbi:MAG: CHAP domain-containing protein [Fusobacterium sp.]|nr:CHAP domain-containing protein [Fusobacterium sp.]